MDSLESKLDRLTPGQRREVDDFVDFLLQQSGNSAGSTMPAPRAAPPPSAVAPPPFIVEDSLQMMEAPTRSAPDITRETGSPAPTPASIDPPSLIQEIIVTSEDTLTRDYMDYGRFDPPAREPSPADVAVRNVKENLIRKGKEDRTHQLLDWVD